MKITRWSVSAVAGVVLAATLGGCPTGGGGDTGPTTAKFYEAVLAMGIRAGDATAKTAALLATTDGRAVELTGGQSITVAGEQLVGPEDVNGFYGYAATIDPADEYEIRINEPTRGVSTTTVQAPADFDIEAPADEASISGFTLRWTAGDENATVSITLTQNDPDGEQEKTYADLEDTGSYDVGVLAGFSSGADIAISVTKSLEQSVNGVAEGTCVVERTVTATVSATP